MGPGAPAQLSQVRGDEVRGRVSLPSGTGQRADPLSLGRPAVWEVSAQGHLGPPVPPEHATPEATPVGLSMFTVAAALTSLRPYVSSESEGSRPHRDVVSQCVCRCDLYGVTDAFSSITHFGL